MDFLIETAIWFFTETIYGLATLTFIIYWLAALIKTIFKKFPAPELVAGVAFIVLLFTLQSYQRYRFEAETLAQFEKNKHFKLVNYAKWGDLVEPATWFRAPIGFFHYVSPDPTTYQKGYMGTFKSIILRYEEEPIQQLVNIDCENKEISISEPDKEGTLRYTDRFGDKMTEKEVEIYCENDFTQEVELVREYFFEKNN